MPVTVTWFNHASFRIASDKIVVYIDPWKIAGQPADGDVILISHSHYDHLSPDDVAKVAKPKAAIFGPADVAARLTGCRAVTPGEQIQVAAGVRIRGVPAYNVDKKFHPRGNNWLGWIVELDSKRIYYAGDTDKIKEMAGLGPIDLAMLPVGGTYTMDPTTAAEAVKTIAPKRVLPYHWGDIVGARTDADQFASNVGETASVIPAGGSLTLK